MRKLMFVVLVLCAGCIAQNSKTTCSGPVGTSVDWENFLSRLDPVWEQMPQKWFDAPFMGNGMMGTLVRKIGDKQVRWDVGRSDVQGHIMEDDFSVRAPEILNRGRLPIGHFVLQTAGTIQSGNMRLDLWNAESTGTIVTDKGHIKWRTLVHADDMAFLVELEPDAGEVGCTFEFVAEKAESTRLTRVKKSLPKYFMDAYPSTPEPVIGEEDDIEYCYQSLPSDWGNTTAWHKLQQGTIRRYLVTVQHTNPASSATPKAVRLLTRLKSKNLQTWQAAHRNWWHDYYKQSFVSISDTTWESFYWIQMYKLACATRADRSLIDNQGPWLQPTGWNGTWWNLNIQLSYSPVSTANRIELADCLSSHLRRHYDTLIENVEPQYRHDSAGIGRNSGVELRAKTGKPGSWAVGPKDIGSEVGNLTWVCHNVWMQYRCTMDEKLRDELLYPLLKRCVNYYRHFLYEGEDGKLHLPETHSPEYGNAKDANYDLSLIRWGCTTLIDLDKERGTHDPLVKEWQGILEKLTDYPVNENGFMVGGNVPFDKSHRHWSHMLMVYPLRSVTPDNPKDKELIETSLARWHSFKNALVGYSYTGGASFAALLSDGDRALNYLNGFLPFMGKSTMYFEGGSQGLPVMETPLHGSQAMHEMLLQSWGDCIRVFPAMPDFWKDAQFYNLRAEGAFLVSAVRKGGRTQWAAITSEAGQPCVVQIDIDNAVAEIDGKAIVLEKDGQGKYRIDLKKHQTALIYTAGQKPTTTDITPVEADSKTNYFGIKN